MGKCLQGCKRIFPESFKEEAKSILRFAWPIFISNICDFIIPMISLLFLGQYGKTYLAASGLAISFCNMFGITLVFGMNTALQTLCLQSYGAKNYRKFGIVVQRALVLELCAICFILPLWINSERILIGLGQDRLVSKWVCIYFPFGSSNLKATMLNVEVNILQSTLIALEELNQSSEPENFCST